MRRRWRSGGCHRTRGSRSGLRLRGRGGLRRRRLGRRRRLAPELVERPFGGIFGGRRNGIDQSRSDLWWARRRRRDRAHRLRSRDGLRRRGSNGLRGCWLRRGGGSGLGSDGRGLRATCTRRPWLGRISLNACEQRLECLDSLFIHLVAPAVRWEEASRRRAYLAGTQMPKKTPVCPSEVRIDDLDLRESEPQMARASRIEGPARGARDCQVLEET